MAGAAVWTVAWIATPLPSANADCTVAGDFGAGAGCAPPGSGTSSQAWPPSSVDWPPGGSDTDSGGKGGGGGGGHDGGTPESASPPIVVPNGQVPVTKSQSMTSSGTSGGAQASARPIVPVGPSSAGSIVTPTTTPIVTPAPAD